ncbi:3-methyladenine DNA glycosylase [Demequina lutea]|uniref:3-methyladenine DNA glycosylase n=1 Tax=Demequina lutea TaxID=431489 RepID=A0A7Y9Z8T0_9MICO|nr:3-methyladenine DNA glycosylase [Demequina lutea]NYI40894.1 hypothetical protein [Demequina lutea]
MTLSTYQVTRVLAREEWEPLARAHAARADAATAGHRERAPRHERHPVEDFVYEYYNTRPMRLRRWHPGIGLALEDAAEHAQWRHYTTRDGATFADAAAFWEARGRTVDYVDALLRATASRPARLGCFGLHEWAMVYRADDDRRHPLPLRLGRAGTDGVVEEHKIVCTHVDAFRFFTPEAAPLNATQLTRETQVASEQPGCLHANMDLYKWASKLVPAVSSELIMDAFELAMEIRSVDMQASPYDVRQLGLTPIAIETVEGKREYTEHQAEFAVIAAALRERLIDACAAIREAAEQVRA